MKVIPYLVATACLYLLTACGGGSNISSPPPPVVPTPSITALSPNSSKEEGQAFTLSVVGANFDSTSTVQWNGNNQPTTFVNASLITAAVPASEVATPGPDAVTVANQGSVSTSFPFTVPCAIPAPSAAFNQTHARLGAYYFDGWSGPLTNSHFNGLPLGPFQDRQPLSGWQDNSDCPVEQQLATAHNFGIDFFVFDWYFNTAVNDPGEDLNSALKITHNLSDRHGMQYAILYVDSPPFVAQPADWAATVNEWVGYMVDPAYVKVNGKPLLMVIDMEQMRQAFGSSSGVTGALGQLRTAAMAQGLSGVYVVGGFFAGHDHNTQSGNFPDLSTAVADGYDAVSFYNYSFGTVSGGQPFSVLSEAGQWIWSQAAAKSPLPFIPAAMDGWDPRPWAEGNVFFSRSPQEVAAFVSDEIAWANSNPQLRPEPSPTPPIVLVEAWNEFGEGSHLIPTVGEGTSYGDALAALLEGP